jgi:hypothetical protein
MFLPALVQIGFKPKPVPGRLPPPGTEFSAAETRGWKST